MIKLITVKNKDAMTHPLPVVYFYKNIFFDY